MILMMRHVYCYMNKICLVSTNLATLRLHFDIISLRRKLYISKSKLLWRFVGKNMSFRLFVKVLNQKIEMS